MDIFRDKQILMYLNLKSMQKLGFFSEQSELLQRSFVSYWFCTVRPSVRPSVWCDDEISRSFGSIYEDSNMINRTSMVSNLFARISGFQVKIKNLYQEQKFIVAQNNDCQLVDLKSLNSIKCFRVNVSLILHIDIFIDTLLDNY